MNNSNRWNEENELMLAESVLRHIRQGKSEKDAFKEVSDHLNKSMDDCQMYWEQYLKVKYERAIMIARQQRKTLTSNTTKVNKNMNSSSHTQEGNMSKVKTNSEKRKSISQVNHNQISNLMEQDKNLETITIRDALLVLSKQIIEIFENDTVEHKMENELIKENKELKSQLDKVIQERDEILKEYQMIMDYMNKAKELTEEKSQTKVM